MKINIAICDDEKEICTSIERALSHILERKSIHYETDIFCSGEDLCEHMKKKRYNLLFLDINLPEMSGIDVGNVIRQKQEDELMQIVFISSEQENIKDLFDVRPLNFLVKPFDEERVEREVNRYIKVTGQDNRMFTYAKNGEVHNIPLENIMYFMNDKRKVRMVAKDEERNAEFYDTLDNIYSQIKGHRFLFIHKSVIVNYEYISSISYKEVKMTDGTTYTISQSRRKDIRKQVKEILREIQE